MKRKRLFLPNASEIGDESFELGRERDFGLALIVVFLSDVLHELIDRGIQRWILLFHLSEQLIELLGIGRDQGEDRSRQCFEQIGEGRTRREHILEKRVEKALKVLTLLVEMRRLRRLTNDL